MESNWTLFLRKSHTITFQRGCNQSFASRRGIAADHVLYLCDQFRNGDTDSNFTVLLLFGFEKGEDEASESNLDSVGDGSSDTQNGDFGISANRNSSQPEERWCFLQYRGWSTITVPSFVWILPQRKQSFRVGSRRIVLVACW